ncbi:cold-regulated 1 [Chlorella sorokiniana]|uniref:Cold-regulated 1 n=1 Tax=Chlorella sorokiniana TaxID=3076 RepID=A0A2P6TXD7_CHLSO|nr:cold-regulated 1 [Chlorella sorokiniana]|eukprot:PRW58726.1 cold-regulated 1 [Chlorella sorokiniana]
MEKIKEAFTGKSKEERVTERESGHTAGATGTYAEQGAYGAGGTEYTGGAAGGPAYGTAATGYTEGATETETRVGTVEVPVVQQTTTTTAGAAEGEAAVCAQVEDRPVVKERVEMIKEHRPVEKEFVVETRQTGVEREVGGGEVEHLGTTERIVSVTPPSAPCE